MLPLSLLLSLFTLTGYQPVTDQQVLTQWQNDDRFQWTAVLDCPCASDASPGYIEIKAATDSSYHYVCSRPEKKACCSAAHYKVASLDDLGDFHKEAQVVMSYLHQKVQSKGLYARSVQRGARDKQGYYLIKLTNNEWLGFAPAEA